MCYSSLQRGLEYSVWLVSPSGIQCGFAPQKGLDKCMACLSKMVGINLWLASANRFG